MNNRNHTKLYVTTMTPTAPREIRRAAIRAMKKDAARGDADAIRVLAQLKAKPTK